MHANGQNSDFIIKQGEGTKREDGERREGGIKECERKTKQEKNGKA